MLGAGLLLTGAALVTYQSWPDYGSIARAVALLAGAAIALLAAERYRDDLPVTATIDAHIGTFLAAPASIAVLSVFGITWPTCLLVGGLAAAAATELQSRRWLREPMLAGQVAAIALAATGIGGLTDLTAASVVVAAAVGFLAIGANRRAVASAAIAVVSPVLWVCGELDLGPGTLERAGIIGDQLDWSRPLVGLVAGAVFAVVALRTRSQRLWVAAIAAPFFSSIDHLVEGAERLGASLERYGVTNGDLLLAGFSAVALVFGLIARRTNEPDVRPSSWQAYGPGLTIAGLWLVGTVADRNPGWAIPTALTVGVVAAGIGAWLRLAAPLVGGTVIVAATLLVTSGDALRQAPTWAWLVVGGLALLTIGVMIERAGDRERPDLRHLLDGWD